jgi:hypothetical protein
VEGLSKLESEVSQKSETIGGQNVLVHSHVTNEYLDSTSFILLFFPKVSPGIVLLLNNPYSD